MSLLLMFCLPFSTSDWRINGGLSANWPPLLPHIRRHANGIRCLHNVCVSFIFVKTVASSVYFLQSDLFWFFPMDDFQNVITGNWCQTNLNSPKLNLKLRFKK